MWVCGCVRAAGQSASLSARVHARRTMGIRMMLFTIKRLFWQCDTRKDECFIFQVLRALAPVFPFEFSGTAPTCTCPFPSTSECTFSTYTSQILPAHRENYSALNYTSNQAPNINRRVPVGFLYTQLEEDVLYVMPVLHM